MDFLLLVIGFGAATGVLVGVGEKLRLPWPALIVVIGVAGTFVPTFSDIEIDPHLILPLFLPPLLFAAAQKTSWALFRSRWRAVVFLAVALVAVTVAAVTGTAMALIPGISLSAAVALGAMLAPPDPVAVEAVAGTVSMPRRVLASLQSEGLFNDAAALVIFQTALAAALAGDDVTIGAMALTFLVSAVIAVVVGLVLALLVRPVLRFVDNPTARSVILLVFPFAVYILAEHFHASGVVAVVVAALELRRKEHESWSADRVLQSNTWHVLETLVTGIAFGLVGLELRTTVDPGDPDLWRAVLVGLVLAAVLVVVRVIWMTAALVVVRKRHDPEAAPRSGSDVVLMSWGGMRGLATLALALSVPATTEAGNLFPGRDYILIAAAVCLGVTLVLAGLTFPTVVSLLGVKADAEAHHRAEAALAARAFRAGLETIAENEDLSEEVRERLEGRLRALRLEVAGESVEGHEEEVNQEVREKLARLTALQTLALRAARTEVVKARGERGTDPEIADIVLRRLDLQTQLLR